MASLNKVMIIGNAGRDAELRYTANGLATASFSVAVNNRRRGQSGEWEDNTEWFNVVLFGDTAERVSQYITKGKPVYVEGRLQTRNWDDDQGVKYSQCMREHGVKDFPDPVNGRIMLRAGPGSDMDPNSATFKAAGEACRSLQPAGAQQAGGAGGGGDAALAFSKCMRENGVPKFPDPQVDGGKVTMALGPDSGIDPNSAAFKQAQAKCGDLMGGGGPAQGTTP